MPTDTAGTGDLTLNRGEMRGGRAQKLWMLIARYLLSSQKATESTVSIVFDGMYICISTYVYICIYTCRHCVRINMYTNKYVSEYTHILMNIYI
jgi:hypothetical protein